MISISMYLYMDGMLITYKEITKIDALKNLFKYYIWYEGFENYKKDFRDGNHKK